MPSHKITDNVNSTPEHDPHSIQRANAQHWIDVFAAVSVTITEPKYLDPIPGHEADVDSDLLPVGEATIYSDGRVEFAPAQMIEDVLVGVHRPERIVNEKGLERIKEVATDQLVKGIDGKRTIVFSGETVTEFIGDKIVHPSFCVDHEKCFSGCAFDQIEHASAVETMTTESFTVEGNLEVITDNPDFRDDIHRFERPFIEVRYPGNRDDARITGSIDELRKLAAFIIEQANRFEEYVNDVSGV